jgi:hypothetical protein
MIEIDIKLGSKYVSPRREQMICVSGALELIVAKSVVVNRGIVIAIMEWIVQLQLDDGGENS